VREHDRLGAAGGAGGVEYRGGVRLVDHGRGVRDGGIGGAL
jgi:hypothetical protein